MVDKRRRAAEVDLVKPPAPGPLWPIQVIPPGLTGLLQLKQLGRLPDKLSDQVVPIVEMRDWYLTARRLPEIALFPGAQPSTGLLSAAQFTTFSNASGVCAVPANQIWYVEQMSANAVGTALADVCSIALGINPPQGGAVQWVSALQPDYVGTRIHRFMVHADRGFWAFPGDQFILGLFDVASAGGINFFLSLRATPCPL